MEEVFFIEMSDLLYFYEEEMKYAGTNGWIRDHFELEACLDSPKYTFDGKYLLDIYGMAAKYIVSFAIRHPFSDGNKRIGAISAIVFLEANGYDFREEYDGQLADVIYNFLNNKIQEDNIRSYIKEQTEITG